MAGVDLRVGAALCCLLLIGRGAAEQKLPTPWQTGIATNYGGPWDHMVRYFCQIAPDFSCLCLDTGATIFQLDGYSKATINRHSVHPLQSAYQPSFGTSVGSCGYGVLDKTKFPYWYGFTRMWLELSVR